MIPIPLTIELHSHVLKYQQSCNKELLRGSAAVTPGKPRSPTWSIIRIRSGKGGGHSTLSVSQRSCAIQLLTNLTNFQWQGCIIIIIWALHLTLACALARTTFPSSASTPDPTVQPQGSWPSRHAQNVNKEGPIIMMIPKNVPSFPFSSDRLWFFPLLQSSWVFVTDPLYIPQR